MDLKTTSQGNISPELLKYLRQQNLSTAPVLPAMQQLQDSMDGLLSRIDLREYEKAEQYLELQNRCLTLKHQFNARPRQSDETKDVLPVIRKIIYPPLYKNLQQYLTAVTTSTPLNLFITTPSLNLALTKQEPTTTTLKSVVLIPPPTVQTPSPAPRQKRPRIQFVNYLDTDDDKPKRRSRRYRYIIKLSPTSILRIKKTNFTRS